MVVAHYTPGTIQSACQEAKRLHIGCVVTDPIDLADLDANQASAITYSGETYCDLDWLGSTEAQGQFLAQCVAAQRSVL
jgi:4-hydroxy-L-threonine phosphate dehydrogenase PdxA